MNKKICTNKNKGFSLVELIVVIAIMAVLTAVLAPALLQYVERSRAAKDNSAMGELTNAVKLAMADQNVYDELLMVESGKDGVVPSGYAATQDETAAAFAGEQRGVMITFKPEANNKQSVVKLADGIINGAAAGDTSVAEGEDGKLGGLTAGDGKYHMINALQNIVGEEITLVSQTYRNSDYTVFIKMGTLGAADSAIAVEGAWNGTNLPSDGSASGGDGGSNQGDSITIPAVGTAAEDCTWEQIKAIGDAGKADEYFNIGDTKTFILNDGSNTQVVMEIVAFNADAKADGAGTAAITWLSRDVIAMHCINSTYTNAGGWEGSELRNWLRTDVYSTLPVALQSAIVPVNKTYYIANGAVSTYTCEDNVWIPSDREIFGVEYSREDSGPAYSNRFYDFASNVKKYNGSAVDWWTRTDMSVGSPGGVDYIFRHVEDYGGNNGTNLTQSLGVVLGFCT